MLFYIPVYYKDDGHLVLKVDVSMKPELTIKQAHISALNLRVLIENTLPGVANVDVDLELDDNITQMSIDNSRLEDYPSSSSTSSRSTTTSFSSIEDTKTVTNVGISIKQDSGIIKLSPSKSKNISLTGDTVSKTVI